MTVKIVKLPSCPVCGCNSCDCGAKDFHDAVVSLQAKVERLEKVFLTIRKVKDECGQTEGIHYAFFCLNKISEIVRQALEDR